MDEKILLDLVGITYNQIESGVYAVILQERGAKRRLPIIIGSAEAQSIECRLQKVITPRPLTHDLMTSVMHAFDISLKEVRLHRLPSGVFAADVILIEGDREVTIDSRSSDAIALAVRNEAPIYTSRKVLDEAGYDPDNNRVDKSAELEVIKHAIEEDLSVMNERELKAAMAKAVEEENYEEAARIKLELESRIGK